MTLNLKYAFKKRIPCAIAYWAALFMLLSGSIAAQSNRQSKIIDLRKPHQVLDSFTIAPGLAFFADSAGTLPLHAPCFGLYNNVLRIDTACLRMHHISNAQALVRYRRLSFNLESSTSGLDTAAISNRKADNNNIAFDYTPYQPPKNIWDNPGLAANGSYTRGLSLGNAQSLVFNSNLNLQLAGRIGNDLELNAAISDNSIPIQPDGTTRQLQEFDRIYIQLKKQKASLIAGDYELGQPRNYFSRYFKKLQGLAVEWRDPAFSITGTPQKPTDSLYVRAAAALSKGKFARQNLTIQEGNQGPYRLQGAEGERFIIVLAGTEKVYRDGILLTRGLEDDYTIDYNLAELRFTARKMITKDTRILVEFEYAVQNYLRSNLESNIAWNRPKARFYASFFSEQDSKKANAPVDLSRAEKLALAAAGDDLTLALASGIDTLTDGFDPNRVLYRAVDTVVCGQVQRILVYSNDPEKALYAARFSEVAQGKGNYVQIQSAANGRVYQWVAPNAATCEPQGNYEPVVRVIAPEKRQLYTAGAELRPSQNTAISTEVALSNKDLNRFSFLGNADNVGLAGMLGLQHQWFRKQSAWRLRSEAQLEFAGQNFNPLNPYRNAEFTRDWNVDATLTPANEWLPRAGAELRKGAVFSAKYAFGGYFRGDLYNGIRHGADANFTKNGWNAVANFNYLNSESSAEKTAYLRAKTDVSKQVFSKKQIKEPASANPKPRVGLYIEREKNFRREAITDTLTARSFYFDIIKPYFEIPAGGRKWNVGGYVSRRLDYKPVKLAFLRQYRADDYNLNGAFILGKSEKTEQQFKWNVNYRHLFAADSVVSEQKNAVSTYLGRLDYGLKTWKNAVSLNSGYEISSGQSPKIEFNYLKVNPGEGTLTWIDRNRDSVLQVDEMEIAVFLDQADYIRVAINNGQYIRTDNILFNQTLFLEPRQALGVRKQFWGKFAGKWSAQSTLQINRNVRSGIAGVSAWNPFDLRVQDTALVSIASSTRHILYFNRGQRAWETSGSYSDVRSRLVLSTGFESRTLEDWLYHGRVTLSRMLILEADLTWGRKTSTTENFANRNYLIRTREVQGELSFQPKRTVRLSGTYHWQTGANQLGLLETARQNDGQLELTWNPATKSKSGAYRPATSIRAKFKVANIRYTGEANTPTAYALLEGLQNGKNLLWNLNLDRQLSKAMLLNIGYEGRKTGKIPVVHVARAQIRALF